MKQGKQTDPTFIVDTDSGKICSVNEVAISRCTGNPVGQDLNELIHIEKPLWKDNPPAYFNNQWFYLRQETLLREGRPHLKVRLEQCEDIPNAQVLEALQKMIGFLVHRFRSPLTGIRGYAELIEKDPDQNCHYLDQINSGTEELFYILDELKSFEEISLDPLEANNSSAKPEEVIRDILSGYPTKQRERISYRRPATSRRMSCNPGDLQRILSILLENAIEYSPLEKHHVCISQPSANAITISHNGNPIPEQLAEKLFFPFITSKARKLGIGLTMALLYARRYKGSIFLTENKPFSSVSFTFCLPPFPLQAGRRTQPV